MEFNLEVCIVGVIDFVVLIFLFFDDCIFKYFFGFLNILERIFELASGEGNLREQ